MSEPAFFEALDTLSAGERTALRRSAGTMLAEADGRALAAFYRCLPYTVEAAQDRWYAAACFHCLWDPDCQPRLPAEEAFRKLIKSADSSESLEHRLAALLDLSWADDGYLLTKLSRILRLLQQKDYCIDCSSLLDDLLGWNSDKQYVQRKWARRMYQENTTDKQKGD